MYSLSVLQVVDPSCFFCMILKESDSEEYEHLFAELNFLYSMVYKDVEELKPASLPVGTFCVVFYEKRKSWCRAILESTACSAQGELVDCFLLDYAVYCPIKKSNIRFPVKECEKLPFRARKFRLHQIRPISLCIDILENKSEMRPAKSWDTSAIHYFRKLLNDCLKIEAQFCSVEDNCVAVDLYLTTADSVICANDDLVAKKYACYDDGVGNGKAVVSSDQILQNRHTSIPLTIKQPQAWQEPGVVSIPGQTLQQEGSDIHQEIDLADKFPAQRREEDKVNQDRRFTDSQNEKPLVCFSEARRLSAAENVVVIPPQPKESEFPASPQSAARSPDPFLHAAWCKADAEQISHTEAAEKPAAGIRDAEIQPSKYALSAQSPKEDASNSVSKELPMCVFGGATSPREQQQTESLTFQMVASPDPFLRPVCAQEQPSGIAGNKIAEIRVNGDEAPNPNGQEKPQRSEIDAKVECDPAQFVWPAWSNRDLRHRLSTEIKEKSLAKLRWIGEKEPEIDKIQGLTKLLQFLSPTPRLLPEEESRKPLNMLKPERAVFVSKSLAPCSTLDDTSLCTDIKKRLIMCGYNGPYLTESYCWAPIAEGFDTLVICPDGSNPIYYIPPLLTYLSCASTAYKLLPAKHGPHAVIVCPGWSKAHAVYKLLMELSKCIRSLCPMLLLVGLAKDDVECINFRKPCEVVVTTPHCLLRCLEHHGLLLLRLCHLVLHEVDVLFSRAGAEMSEILQLYKKIVTVENREGTPQQIVAVGSKWIQDMRPLMQYTSMPRVVITRMEQAAVFANVQQIVQLCLDCDKMSVLVQCLDYAPVDVQKLIIYTKDDAEAELVHKAVQTASVFSLLLTNNLVHNFSHVLEQWKKACSHRTVLVLVVTDDFAPLLEITDATCIIHYSFPENVGVLSLRLFSLLDYIQDKIDKISMDEDDYSRAKSVLLMTEKHASCAIDLLQSFQQAEAKVPPELVALAQGLSHAQERKKRDRDLCPHLKTFGYCNQDEYSCPCRHHINPLLDLRSGEAAIPGSDPYITVVPFCIADASRFLGRVITKNDPYAKLAAELNEYYQSPVNKIPAKKVEDKHLYAISDGSDYHRVQVISTKAMDSVSYAHVQYIDDGKTDEIPVHTLFLLPPAFQSVPPQFREFIVCRVKPIDNEDKWDPKLLRIITRRIRGKQHRAKVVLHLGGTYWLDPMVQVTPLSDLLSCVYDLNVRQEILSTGLGTDNPQHIVQLKSLLENSGTAPVSENSRQEMENDVLPTKPTEDMNAPTAPCLGIADADDDCHIVVRGPRLSPQSDEDREQLTEGPCQNGPEAPRTPPSASLYPVVKWFEKGDTVILTVKLQQVTDPKCTFYRDRLVFSCDAGGKHYSADMDLYSDIVKDKSTCKLKNGEAVITIQKSGAEMWDRLLKDKHPNVSFDFDHLGDSEDDHLGFGSGFNNKTQKFYNVVSEELVSSEYSDSESD